MTNYEKYAGTPERFADFMLRLDCEGGDEEEFSRQICAGNCYVENEDTDCTEEKFKKCIISWLNSEYKEGLF